MEETTTKKRRGIKGFLSWLYLLAAITALVLTVKCCCPSLYTKAEHALGLDENGRTAEAFSALTQRLEEGKLADAFAHSYRTLRGNEA